MKKTNDEIYNLINRRRRQILVHSIIYYELNDNLVSDHTWSEWAVELENLQKQYPKIADQVPLSEAFSDFEHSSGQTLPLDDSWGLATAKWLLNISKSRK